MPDHHNRYEDLLRENGCRERVIRHCRAVTECALHLSKDCPFIDRPLLEAGAMLHDIGRGTSHSIAHAQAGADLCRYRGIPEPVARIVERHTGAGLSADECTLLRLMPRDCVPRTPEEKLVAHADNLTEGSNQVSIHSTLFSAIHLNKKIRRRIYHLALDVEILCKQ